MTTFTLNTMLRGTKAAFLAFTLVIASFGAGCEGAEGFEGDEEAVEMGQTQQAIKGAIGLAPDQVKQKCEDNGRVYDPSTNGCSQTCAPGFVVGADGLKCITPKKKCEQKGDIWDNANGICTMGAKNKCEVEGKIWSSGACKPICKSTQKFVPSGGVCPGAVDGWKDCSQKGGSWQYNVCILPVKCEPGWHSFQPAVNEQPYCVPDSKPSGTGAGLKLPCDFGLNCPTDPNMNTWDPSKPGVGGWIPMGPGCMEPGDPGCFPTGG